MNKKHLTEQEVRTQFITPAIQKAGWSVKQIREDYAITAGRIIARGGAYSRAKPRRVNRFMNDIKRKSGSSAQLNYL